jgi:hypothetical protein
MGAVATQVKAPLLTVEQVAARLVLPRRALLVGPLRDELPWLRVGGKALRLEPAALEAYLATRLGGRHAVGIGSPRRNGMTARATRR